MHLKWAIPSQLTVTLYRRDRRKDALLQQHGYFVLRFLAEDAGKELDHVLDTILAALAHRQNRKKEKPPAARCSAT